MCSFQSCTMKQMAVDRKTPFLPEEIIRSILKRLPVKSLIRFHCVCKHWKDVIKTPSFIADHLHHSTHQSPSLLFQENDRHPLQLRLLDCEMQVREVRNTPLIDSSSWVKIIGSSNGLLCVAINEADVYPASILLWNPATGEIRQVPRTRTIDRFDWDCTVGFGFSPIINDYKIVRTYAESGYVISGVEVYSLSTGSWKEIELGNLENVNLYLQTVSANGAIFWNGIKLGVEEGGEDDTDLIVSFDIAMEVFTLIPMPNSFSKLGVYDDKLAVLSHSRIGDFPNYLCSFIDLWVLEEGIGSSTKRWSWTKKCTCGPLPSALNLGVIWRNEIACVAFGKPRLVSETRDEIENDEPKIGLYLFSITTNEFKMIAIPGCGSGRDVFNYVESLVPLGNNHIEEP
ncbi:F-box/kelch-repeat protein At3g06240-like [Neltuma alba]|uniref:F-box/kelch-repeat protein At3g06240-like n=1 Tax=Neltuma alba TaxID=207710 RepID=UPI0010A55823|nr:F-box/kelch-repeat protein At3g06240-like [Prosopis alba]